MVIREYKELKPTERQIEESNIEFEKPVKDWDIRFLLGAPYPRIIDHAKTAIPMMCHYARIGVPIATCGQSDRDVQRNEFGIALLAEDYDYLVMLDLDQENGADIFERLYYIAKLRPECEVVAMNVAIQEKPHYPAWYYMTDDGDMDDNALIVPMEWEEDKGLVRAGMVGTGAIMIKRSVLQKLPFPWFQNDYSKAAQGEYIREDLYFSRLCREHGVKMWVDTQVKIPHYTKNEAVTVDNFVERKEKYGEEILFGDRKWEESKRRA